MRFTSFAAVVILSFTSLLALGQERRASPFPILKETTHVTGPVRPDGTIDYLAALNEIHGKDATAQNNAAVIILRVIGPWGKPGEPEQLQKMRAALGMPPAAEEGRLFVPLGRIAVSGAGPVRVTAEEAKRQLDQAMEGPWKDADLPAVAAWLDAVNRPLDLIAIAMRRPRYFVPAVPGDGPPMVIQTIFPDIGAHRVISDAFQVRALRRLGVGDFDGFRNDVLAMLRQGRLVAQGPTLTHWMLGVGCEANALNTVRTAAIAGRLNESQMAALLEDLRVLPKRTSMADVLDRRERYVVLDLLSTVAVHGIEALRHREFTKQFVETFGEDMQKPGQPHDWGAAMKVHNGWIDRYVVIAALPSSRQRLDGARAVEDERKKFMDGLFERRPPPGDQYLVASFLPRLDKLIRVEERVATDFELTELALALRAHKAKHGKYPEKLEAIAPAFGGKVPSDRFADTPFHFSVAGDGYLLYSVGANGRDDGGTPYPQADDVVVKAER